LKLVLKLFFLENQGKEKLQKRKGVKGKVIRTRGKEGKGLDQIIVNCSNIGSRREKKPHGLMERVLTYIERRNMGLTPCRRKGKPGM